MQEINLVKELDNLPDLTKEAVLEFHKHLDRLVDDVNDTLESRSDIASLIGHNQIETMRDNHRNSANFMLNVFKLDQPELLVQTMPWVYHTYRAHHFSSDYWPAVLQIWIEMIDSQLSTETAKIISSYYKWILNHHETWIRLAEHALPPKSVPDTAWQAQSEAFLEALLNADHHTCLKMIASLSSRNDVENFFIKVIQPAMIEIGRLWQTGDISVAQEHLASSIVTRVMSSIYTLEIERAETRNRKALITSSPNEYHEIGAWMISDLLELNGWNIHYLGANTPRQDVVRDALTFQPDLLVVSVTMSFNLDKTRLLVDTFRQDSRLKNTRVMVGGQVFQSMPNLWQQIGADASADDAARAVQKANMLV